MQAGGLRGGSTLLRRLGNATTRPTFGILIGALVVIWAGVGALTRFPPWWQTTLYSVSASITLVMVFVLQHTHNHQQIAVQRKLDEVIRSLPQADDRLISAESATSEQLLELSERHLADRSRATSAMDDSL